MVMIGAKNISIKKVILVTLSLVIGLPIVYIVGAFALNPLFKEIDKSRIGVLEAQSKAIMRDLQTKAGSVETFTYDASCIHTQYGAIGSNESICTTLVQAIIPTRSASQALALHDKFFSTIDESEYLEATSELDNEPARLFGKEFIVSGVEKKYKMQKADATCSYVVELSKIKETTPQLAGRYGVDIEAGNGQTVVYLRCETKALDQWIEP